MPVILKIKAMKKTVKEFDSIGGQGSLTKEEEIALSQYFAKKKNVTKKKPYSSILR